MDKKGTKKILVTGSAGFVGKALCERLSETYDVLRFDKSRGDITNPDTFIGVNEIDYVFHLAARTFVPDSWIESLDFYNTNVMGTGNILEFCRKNNIPLTYVSAYIYGDTNGTPIKEDSAVNPNNPYALSKCLAEQLCSFYAKYFSMDITVVRPFNVFGEGQPRHFLISKIIDSVTKLEDIELFDLSPRRDFIYISDVIEALIKTMGLKKLGFNIFNIGSGKSLSVKDVVDIIQDSFGTNLTVLSKEIIRREELSNVCADISKSSEILNWQPKVSFTEGIMRIKNGK